MWSRGLMALLLVILPSCINIETQIQPINQTVKAVIAGNDCTPIFMGLGAGVITVEHAAKWHLSNINESQEPVAAPITRIRSITLHDWQVLMFGERCLEVVGEP